jgi:hypothetical protein
MSKYKEDILKLRSKDKTYDEICEILNCSKGTVSYHCRNSGDKDESNRSTKIYYKNCPNCEKLFVRKRDRTTYCSQSCASEDRWKDDEYRSQRIKQIQRKCSTLEEKKRLRKIGRKGGFGNSGTTKGGTRYESNLEKECFEWLEKQDIDFEPHKNLPNSSKVSDIYFPKEKLWIEIDGINREKKKEWLETQYKYWKVKLEQYEERNLKLEVIKSKQELKNVIL